MRLTIALRWFTGSVLFLAGQAPASAQEDPLDRQRKAEGEPQVLVEPVEGVLDAALVDRATDEVRQRLRDRPRIQFVVFELSTSGGDAAAAERLATFIAEDLKGATTVAFVPPDKLVLAEGVLVAVACGSIVMGKDSRLGADSARKDPPPAEEAALKEKLRRFAARRGYPTVLTDAMVSRNHEDIFLQRYAEGAGNGPEKLRFKTRSDLQSQSQEEKRQRRGEEQLVLEKGKLLVLSAEEAFRYEITRHKADDLRQLRLALNIAVGDENVIDASHGPLKAENPAGQALIDFLNRPFPRFLLLLCGCLAFLIELKTFGTFIPGTIALACFAVFFVGASLPVSGSLEGTASLWEILLFVIGMALLAAEFLLLPGMGIFAVSGAALCAVSLVLAMVPANASAFSEERTMTDAVEEAIATLAFGFGAGSLCFLLLLRYLPHNPVFARKGLVSSTVLTGVPTADSAIAAQAAQATLLGKTGLAATTLRPAGKVELEDGRTLDVVAQGEFIEKGTRVKVVECEGGITLVSRAEG